MKRIYKNIGWIIGGLMLLAGCDISNRDNDLSEPLVYFINSGEITEKLYNTGEDATYNIPVFKSGLIEKGTNVELIVDNALLENYNQSNNKQAELLPEQYYQIPARTQAMEATQKKTSFQVVLKTSELAKDPNRDNYILPLTLISKGEVQTNEDKSSIILSPSIQKTTFGFKDLIIQKIIDENATEDIELTLPISTCFPNKWEINFDAAPEPSLLKDWNSQNNTAYPAMTTGYELTGDFNITAGNNEQTIKLTIHPNQLPQGWSAIPVSLSNPSKFEIEESQNICMITVLKGKTHSPRISHSLWEITSFSSEDRGSEVAKSIIDDNYNTFWSANWHAPAAQLPQWLIFKLDKPYVIDAFEIRRRTGTYNTDLKHGHFELSLDGTNWTKVTEFEFGKETSTGDVPFYCPPTKGQYIKIFIDESNRTPSVSVAELNAQGTAVE